MVGRVPQDQVVQTQNALFQAVGNLKALPLLGRKLVMQLARAAPRGMRGPPNQHHKQRDGRKKKYKSYEYSVIHSVRRAVQLPIKHTPNRARCKALPVGHGQPITCTKAKYLAPGPGDHPKHKGLQRETGGSSGSNPLLPAGTFNAESVSVNAAAPALLRR
jgi:hypothetical protein